MKVAVIGLGYVGLPLSLYLAKKVSVIGFDLNKKKIKSLKNKIDLNKEANVEMFKKAKNIIFSSDEVQLKNQDIYIIAVPTPVDKKNKPDLSLLLLATKTVAKYIKNQSIVIIESTVYPGTTEEICAPLLEKISKLKFLKDNCNSNDIGFYCGFCPERVNPGDRKHKLSKITKVISGSSGEAIARIKTLYKIVNGNNIYIAPSIKVAEAAKIIENTQRDLNISLVNEFSKIFSLMKIDTNDVLKTAGTKWNFLKFKPGLVGGHCIGVDPYYLTYKSQQLNYKPKIILAGRKINNSMANYVFNKLNFYYRKKNIKNKIKKCLVIGVSFKENVPDIRNSKALELVNILKKNQHKVDIYDPVVNEKKIMNCKIFKKISEIKKNQYDSIILAVPHSNFIKILKKNINSIIKTNSVFFDLKGIFSKEFSDFRL